MSDNNVPKWEDTEPLFEETTAVDDTPSFESTSPIDSAPNKDDDTLLSEAIGTGTGTAVGYGVGKAIAAPLEKKALDAIAADMGFGKQISEELGDVEKRRLSKMAVDKDIYGILADAEDQKDNISKQMSTIGKQQSDLYKKLAPNAEKVSVSNLVEQLKKSAAPNLSIDKSEMNAYKQSLRQLEELTSPSTDNLKIKKLGIEGLQDLKQKYADLAYKEGKSLVGNTDTASMAQKGNQVSRKAIEDLISQIPETGTEELAKLKNINKSYGDLSKIAPGVAKKAGSEARTADRLWSGLKANTIDTAGRGILKGTAKYASKIPLLGGVVGGTVGAVGGALAGEEGQKSRGALAGATESVMPESIGNAEMPRSQMAMDALEQDMRIKKEVREMPTQEKVQVVDALKGKLDYTPEEIQQVSEQLMNMKGGESYSEVLNKIVSSPERTRKATLFGLLQQPAFRELMKKLENE